MNTVEIPLFPLQAVLFPGGPMPLKIFEPRYLGMISRCLKDNAGFGVVLIRDGAEVGPATTYDVGTLASIDDWYQGEVTWLENLQRQHCHRRAVFLQQLRNWSLCSSLNSNQVIMR